jgi:hypothetical protein
MVTERGKLMGTTADRGRFGWATWLVYPVLAGLLRVLYVAANRAYGSAALEGNLSPTWWLLVLLYFVVDVLLVLGVMFLGRMLTASGTTPKKSFWYVVSETVPIWLLLHLALLLFEYPVSSRLERVGLGKLEIIVFTAVMIAGAAAFSRRLAYETPTTDQAPGSPREKIAIISALILAVSILLAVPYFATRPLPRDSLIRAAGR